MKTIELLRQRKLDRLLLKCAQKGFDPLYALIASDSRHLLKERHETALQYEVERQRWLELIDS